MAASGWRAWPRLPRLVAGEIALALAIGTVVLLRLLVALSGYSGPSYSVRQVVLEQGFVAWEGEHTAVRGQVVGQVSGCDGTALELADPHQGAGGLHMLVLFDPQPEWLWRVTRLPGVGALVPSGIPPHPDGPWTVTGRLTLGRDTSCLPNSGYVLVADTYQ